MLLTVAILSLTSLTYGRIYENGFGGSRDIGGDFGGFRSSGIGFNRHPNNQQCDSNKIVTRGYSRIRGPRHLDDKIVIVGGGMGGVHMASLLKERGYMNVVILEQRSDVGGKSYSKFYRGAWQEFGTIFLSDIYDQVADLMRRYKPEFQIRPKSPSSVWVNDYDDSSWQQLLIQNTGETNPQVALRRVLAEVDKYDRIHRCLFGNYSSELMPRPTPEVLYQIRGSIQDFLRRNDLTLLEPIFRTFFTSNGYGFINETAAVYGLAWLPPEAIRGVFTPTNGFYILRGGFQELVREIARRNNLNVRLGVDVVQIRRKFGPSGIYVTYKSKESPEVLTERFDFLILSPAMNSLFDIVDFNPMERKLFRHLVNVHYIITLAESDNGRRARDPQSYYNQNIEEFGYSVQASINLYHAKNNITGDDHRLGLRENGPDGRPQETVMYYQLGAENPWRKDVNSIIQTNLFTHFQKFSKSNPKILEQVKWGYYFPRFPPPAADRGYLWDVLDMQGRFNTWYIGSSVCFESLESVVEYNNLLMKIKH